MDTAILLLLEDELEGLTKREISVAIGKEVGNANLADILGSLTETGQIIRKFKGGAYRYSLVGRSHEGAT